MSSSFNLTESETDVKIELLKKKRKKLANKKQYIRRKMELKKKPVATTA
jgi:hypothetical protein